MTFPYYVRAHCFLLILATSIFLENCAPHIYRNDSVQHLVDLMEGSYTSTAQHQQDSANYFDIRLHMKRIWTQRTDGYWLYVEQALAARQDKPYRQRIYHVTQQQNGSFVSAVFIFDDPLRFTGYWKNPEKFDILERDSLTERSGCAVYLTKNSDGSYSGSTNRSDCPSDLRGAKYATSEVTIKADRLISWDRGFDENNNHVWGATKGGYQFIKQR